MPGKPAYRALPPNAEVKAFNNSLGGGWLWQVWHADGRRSHGQTFTRWGAIRKARRVASRGK